MDILDIFGYICSICLIYFLVYFWYTALGDLGDLCISLGAETMLHRAFCCVPQCAQAPGVVSLSSGIYDFPGLPMHMQNNISERFTALYMYINFMPML